MEIKILGGGCIKCKRLEELARKAAGDLGVEATFTKVKDMDAIMAYDVITTPALVIITFSSNRFSIQLIRHPPRRAARRARRPSSHAGAARRWPAPSPDSRSATGRGTR